MLPSQAPLPQSPWDASGGGLLGGARAGFLPLQTLRALPVPDTQKEAQAQPRGLSGLCPGGKAQPRFGPGPGGFVGLAGLGDERSVRHGRGNEGRDCLSRTGPVLPSFPRGRSFARASSRDPRARPPGKPVSPTRGGGPAGLAFQGVLPRPAPISRARRPLPAVGEGGAGAPVPGPPSSPPPRSRGPLPSGLWRWAAAPWTWTSTDWRCWPPRATW